MNPFCAARVAARKGGLPARSAAAFVAGVERNVYGFLCGFLSPWGSVTGEDVAMALDNEPRFFGMGYMIAALGPDDIAAAVRRKVADGRLEDKSGMLDWILAQEGESGE